MVWFNQAHLFHVSNLENSIQESLLAVLKEEGLSRNAYYGDGTPIERSVLDEIRAAYKASTVVFPWQKDDLLMVDNMLVAHGRRPYTGERKTLVAMAEQSETARSRDQIAARVYNDGIALLRNGRR
jgi:hypothetical protein